VGPLFFEETGGEGGHFQHLFQLQISMTFFVSLKKLK
jgi:hypothetical protein